MEATVISKARYLEKTSSYIGENSLSNGIVSLIKQEMGDSPRVQTAPDHLRIDILPKRMQDVINRLSTVYDVPADMVLCSMLTAISAIVGNSVRIKEKKYTNTLCIWMLLVAASSSGKSPVSEWIFQPLFDIDVAAYVEYRKAMREWRKAKDDSQPKPVLRQLLADDVTEQALDVICVRNPRGCTVYCDEWLGRMSRLSAFTKSDASELSKAMQYWDGNKPIQVARKGDEPITIPHPFLTQMGTTQVDLLSECFGRKSLWDRGYCERYFFCLHEGLKRKPRNDETIPQYVTDLWRNYIQGLYDDTLPEVFYLTDGAQKLYDEYVDSFIPKYSDNTLSNSIFGKLHINILRWAGLVSIARREDMPQLICDADTMRYSIECMSWFERNALRVVEISLGGGVKKMKMGELVRAILKVNPKASQNDIAKALGTNQPYICKLMKS